jgi:hypothetical protein
VRFEPRIPFVCGFDFIQEQCFLGMTDGVVKIDIMSQAAIHVANKRQKRCNSDPARDPDLFHTSSLVIEHPIGAFNDCVRAFF